MKGRSLGRHGSLRLLFFLGLTLLSGACTSRIPEGQCEFDVHCSNGQVCVDHYCRSVCRQDSDCPAGHRCRAGDATGAPSGCVPTPMAMPCVRDSECAAGQACLQGQCRAQCRQDYDCLALNPFNRCINGACVLSCQPGLTDDCDRAVSNGCEVRIDRDPAHCGACGRSCPDAPHARGACAEGTCRLACEPGWADCDGDRSNGCEADLSRPETCGACDVRCQAPRALCAEVSGASGTRSYACTDRCAEPTPDRCGDTCTRRATDPSHCGACGTVCPTGPRAEAVCTSGTCALRCTDTRYADCDRVGSNGCEVDLETSTTHCGACGRACTAGPHAMPTCAGGTCGLLCEAGWADCDGDPRNGCEVDLRTSLAHCGMCSRRCEGGTDARCEAGTCRLGCPASRGDCDGDASNGCETNLSTTMAHCGACGRVCSPPFATGTCSEGSCRVTSCNSSRGDCDGDPSNGCEVDLNTSAAHCGACGRACMAGWFCRAGTCVRDCGDQTACGSSCVDLRSNPSHCGRCGNACSFANAAALCAAGACTLGACNPGYGDCDGNAANGCEVDLRTSTAHCGACNRACSLPNATPVCATGACAIAACNSGFADCDGNAANGCEVDLRTSTAHCGACGRACVLPNATAACTVGGCVLVACNPGFANCDGNATNGCETPILTSVTHCGACNRACLLPNATPICVAGTCAVGTCNTDFADCDGSSANGCEVNLATSSAHCGGCGRACMAGQVCSARMCSNLCMAPTSFCAGRCVDLQTDPSHCGACGNACPARPNATPSCMRGNCGFACNPGFGNCDGNATNGCETPTSTTPTHCGACGNVCNGTNGTPTCTGGVCGITCNAGYGNCDGSATNGCETNLNTSPSHCGGCGNMCNSTNGTPTCTGRVCGITCNAGYGNCDGSAANGCETNLNTSTSHCGGCGMACPVPVNGSAMCASGRCVQSCNPGYYSVPFGAGIMCFPVPPPQQVAPGSFMGTTSRRPTFRWALGSPLNGARIQVCRDRACAAPLVDTAVTGTSFTPSTDLPAGLLWWRLFGRINSNEGLTASPVWQMYVPRRTAARSSAFGVLLDVNGDGYMDQVVGSMGLRVWVYHGTSTGLEPFPARTESGSDGSNFGVTVSAAGDVNGDGYGDVIVGAPGIEMAYVYYGSSSGLRTSTTLRSPVVRSGFGASVSWAGDVNDDGYGDVIVGACWTTNCANAAYVFLGSASGIATTPARTLTVPGANRFGVFVQGIGEVNNDAFDDVVVVDGTTIYPFFGAMTAARPISISNLAGIAFGWDVNGDGYSDLAAVARAIRTSVNLQVHYGGINGLDTMAPFIGNPTSPPGFGAAVAGLGDVNGDGFGEIAWSTQGTNVRVIAGSSSGPNTAAVTTINATMGRGGFGRALSGVGDLNGDGLWDMVVAEPDFATEFDCRHFLRLYRGTLSGISTDPTGSISLPAGGSCADFGTDLAP